MIPKNYHLACVNLLVSGIDVSTSHHQRFLMNLYGCSSAYWTCTPGNERCKRENLIVS